MSPADLPLRPMSCSETAQREAVASMRELADQAFSRAAGAALVTGNSIRVLRDARENYPAWLDSIARASRSIHFESYIIHDDDVGEQFARSVFQNLPEVLPNPPSQS